AGRSSIAPGSVANASRRRSVVVSRRGQRERTPAASASRARGRAMERVAFIVDASGERIDCLLNPESFEIKRLAGVRARSSAGGLLVGAGLADDPLLFTGGGRTEILLDLMFDVDLVESRVGPRDVRALTRPLWRLAENSTHERGSVRPPLVRLVWGKTWNLPG